MKKILAFLFFVVISATVFAQSEPAVYKIYTKDGTEVAFDDMMKDLASRDVVLFGELHNNPICHWLQFRVTKAMYAANQDMAMGAEMFESDNQLLIDEYFAGNIRTKDFEKEARLWPNYETDYKPLLEFAREMEIPFIATNIPRRYAALINRKDFRGLTELSKQALSYIAPTPIPFDTTNPSISNMMKMDFGHGTGGPGIMGMVKSQASKDATMAHFIVKNLPKNAPFLHFQGDFHSREYGGIYWYLKHYKKKLNIATISTVEAGSVDFSEEYSRLADYILVVVNDMTKTY